MTKEEALIKVKGYLTNFLPLEDYDEVEDIMAALEQEPKIGHWLEVKTYEYEGHSVTDMRCNVCGKYASLVLPLKTKCTYDYCPNCGMKMESEE